MSRFINISTLSFIVLLFLLSGCNGSNNTQGNTAKNGSIIINPTQIQKTNNTLLGVPPETYREAVIEGEKAKEELEELKKDKSLIATNKQTIDGEWKGKSSSSNPFIFYFKVKNNQIENFEIPQYDYGKSPYCSQQKLYQDITIYTKNKQLSPPIPINQEILAIVDDSENYIKLNYKRADKTIAENAISLKITGNFTIDQGKITARGKIIQQQNPNLISNRPNSINCVKLSDIEWKATKKIEN